MREKTQRIPLVDENVFEEICQYMIDLKYLNKHLFSKNNVFLVFINDKKKLDSIGRSEGHCLTGQPL